MGGAHLAVSGSTQSGRDGLWISEGKAFTNSSLWVTSALAKILRQGPSVGKGKHLRF